MIWMHVFPGVRTAARCKKAGVQVLIASGHEGGMHTAWQPVHSMTLLPDIIEKFSDENTLVCGTGGFCDGKSIAAAFAMGADGVQMGTRFLATEESDFCELWKKMVVDCADGGTIIARGFVGPARWLRSDVSLQHAYNTAKEAPGSYVGVPRMEARLMMCPAFSCTIGGIAQRQQLYIPVTFTSNSRCQTAGSRSVSSP